MEARVVSLLAAARLTVPQSGSQHVPRQRLTRLLDRAVTGPITVVAAGPGTGKTLAVANWVREGRVPGPVAWVSIDRFLRAPTRFWGAVLTALESATGSQTDGRIHLPEVVDEEFLERLGEPFAGRDVVLVLDDVHELSAEVLTGLDQVLWLPPIGLHVVLISRHDPPLSLHRHRLAGRLQEVRAADLAFTPEEARQLLEAGGTPVPDDTLLDLVNTTGGWAAALRLAVLTMEGADDPQEALRQFDGAQPLVSGYLGEELERSLGPRRMALLLQTCVTDRICVPLALALTADPTAAPVLLSMLGDDPLVVELEGSGWFRYHPLMLQSLRSRLHRDDPAAERELHARASLWYEEAGEWLNAIEHAIASEDPDLVVTVGLRSASVDLFHEDYDLLGAAIARLPTASLTSDPELRLLLALGAQCRGEFETAASLLPGAENALQPLPEPRRSIARLNLQMLKLMVARRAGDAATLNAAASEAARLLGGLSLADAPGWTQSRGIPTALVGVGQLWSGQPKAGLAALREGRMYLPQNRQDTASGQVAYNGHAAAALVLSGEIVRARELALSATRGAAAVGTRKPYTSAAAWLALALAEQALGHDEAASSALRSADSASVSGTDLFVSAYLGLARVREALIAGDVPSARRALDRIDRHLANHPGLEHACRLRVALAVEVELAAGRVGCAQQILATHDERAASTARTNGGGQAPPEEDPLTIVRGLVLVASGGAEQVRAAVSGDLHRPGPRGAAAWVAVALAEDRMRHDALATEAISRALDAVADDGVVLPFLVADPRVPAILRHHQNLVGSHRWFVQLLLGRIDATAPGAPSPPQAAGQEPLTERERAVLAYLPTMRSNAEIAQELGISVNTVKQHLKSVHRKLGVSTRRDAVRAARNLELLSGDGG